MEKSYKCQVQGSFPERKGGGLEEGDLHGQEAKVYFNLGLHWRNS